MTKLLIRLDAGPVGLGHAVRVRGVVDLIAPRPDLVLAGAGDGLEDWFPGVRRVPVGGEADFAALCEAERPDAVLIDLPAYPAGLFATLRRQSIPILCIDDVGGEVDADLIVNGTVLDQYHHYPPVPPGGVRLIGGAYTLVRPAFGASPWTAPSRPAVAIVIGSGDRARDWAFRLLSPELDRRDWGSVTMVVGAAFRDRERLAEAVREAGVVLRHGLAAPELAGLLASASVALITGGMIVYEALAVGVPMVVFPQIENLIPEAAFLAAGGMIEDLGFGGGMKLDMVQAAIAGLTGDPARQQDMSRRQRSLIDGKGMERVAAAISHFLRERIR